MPHVVMRLWPGKSEQQKIQLAEEIVKDVIDVMGPRRPPALRITAARATTFSRATQH